MKGGSTHLAFKPEHSVDLDTGVVLAAPIHSAEAGDTATLGPTLEEAQQNLATVGLTSTSEYPSDSSDENMLLDFPHRKDKTFCRWSADAGRC